LKLLLHVGTEKTGTTAIQRWAARNRKALAAQGVFYSRALGAVNHTKLYLWCLDPSRADDGYTRAAVTSRTELESFRSRLPSEFATEVEQAREMQCHTFLISNEHCQSRLTSRDEVQRAREFLGPYFEQIEILCSLRPQVDMAVSLASTAAKASGRVTEAFFGRVRPDNPYYNYIALYKRWADVFGPDRITLVPFRRSPGLVDFIMRRTDLEQSALEPPLRLNEALDIRVISMINAIRLERNHGTRRADPFAHVPMDLLNLLQFEQRLQPGMQLARRVQARFDNTNSELARRRSDIMRADLEPDWTRYDHPANLDLLEQPCAFAGYLGTLIEMFNERIALLKAQKEMVEAERDAAGGDLARSARHLKMTQRLLSSLRDGAVPANRIGLLEHRVAALGEMLAAAPKSGTSSTGRHAPAGPTRGGHRRRGSKAVA
jgi:hypothetical protein